MPSADDGVGARRKRYLAAQDAHQHLLEYRRRAREEDADLDSLLAIEDDLLKAQAELTIAWLEDQLA
jgi:hypothetical protein